MTRRVSLIATLLALISALAFAVLPTHVLPLFELDADALDGPEPGDDWDRVLLGDGGAAVDTTGVLSDRPLEGPDPSIFTQGGSKDVRDIDQWRYTSGSSPDNDQQTLKQLPFAK